MLRKPLSSFLFLVSVTRTLSSDVGSSSSCSSLSCLNNGQCRRGAPRFGYSADMNEDDPESSSGRNPTYSDEYCECVVGYAGFQCEISLLLCESPNSVCSNGTPCLKAQNDQGGIFYHCECDATKSDLRAAYALHFCRSKAIVFCSSDGKARNSFCTNGGSCRQLVGSTESHQGCNCTSPWEGQHCQFLKSNAIPLGTSTEQSLPQEASSPSFSLIIMIVGICIVAVALLAALFLWKSRKARENCDTDCWSIEMDGHQEGSSSDVSTSESRTRTYGEIKIGSRDII